MRNRINKLLVVLLLAALVLTACGTTDEGSTDTILRVANSAEAASLDPQGSNDTASARVHYQIYDTLVVQTEDLELVPGLATEWEQIDELTYEFTLREGVTFHNGEAFTADDVVFTLKRALTMGDIAHIVSMIDGDTIEAVSDYVVRLSTVEPNASLITHLAHGATGILNEEAVTEGGEDYGQNPVGTGPFKFVNWQSGSEINLERNDDYWGEVAKVAGIQFKFIVETGPRLIELESGEVDIAYDIDPNDVQKVADNADLTLYRDSNLSTTYVGFNAGKEGPMGNVLVRQAINHAINMTDVVNTVYAGLGSPAFGPIGENVWGANTDLEPYAYDVDLAKELLAEAGYADGFSISLWTNENAQRRQIAAIIQNQLADIGIEVDVQVLEWATYLEETNKGEHDMFILGWTTVTADADYGLYALFHSSQHGSNGSNRTFYTNTRVDELLDLGRRTIDADDRLAAYYEAQELIRDDAPWIFTWNGENVSASSTSVTGFRQHPNGSHKLASVSVAASE